MIEDELQAEAAAVCVWVKRACLELIPNVLLKDLLDSIPLFVLALKLLLGLPFPSSLTC